MKCEVCGKKFEEMHYIATRVCGNDCFYTKHWLEIKSAMEKGDRRYVIVNGEVYFVRDENELYKGYSGKEFRIRMLRTGEEFTTTNLWHNGRVCEIKDDKLRAYFRNTAEFV